MIDISENSDSLDKNYREATFDEVRPGDVVHLRGTSARGEVASVEAEGELRIKLSLRGGIMVAANKDHKVHILAK